MELKKWSWNVNSDVIYGQSCNFEPKSKLAMFDMDGTIIETKRRKKRRRGKKGSNYPVDSDDWVFFNEEVVPKIQELYKNGYSIVIFTNQKGISLGFVAAEELQQKIEKFVKELGVEAAAFLASHDNEYRKPGVGMFNLYIKIFYKNIEHIDLKQSFYVGDAAGRDKDHSNCDKLLAKNIGVRFFVPEQIF